MINSTVSHNTADEGRGLFINAGKATFINICFLLLKWRLKMGCQHLNQPSPVDFASWTCRYLVDEHIMLKCCSNKVSKPS